MKLLSLLNVRNCFFIGLLAISSNLQAKTLTQMENYCLIVATNAYNVNIDVYRAILAQEGADENQIVHHPNGAVDIGRAQLNKGGSWYKFFINAGISKEALENNSCVNILGGVHAFDEEKRLVNNNIPLAIGNYHRGYSKTFTKSRMKYFESVNRHFQKIIKESN
jgi:hypothetical protein